MKRIKTALGVVAAGMAAAIFAMAGNTLLRPVAAVRQDSSSPSVEGKSSAAPWLTDFEAARQQAKAEHKAMLLDFTGSDWCPWCMKLDREILATPEFNEFADKHLVLVKVDFPMHHPQSSAEKTQNEELAARFQIEGYPTLVVLAPDDHPLGTLGYLPGGPTPLLEKLAEMVASQRPARP